MIWRAVKNLSTQNHPKSYPLSLFSKDYGELSFSLGFSLPILLLPPYSIPLDPLPASTISVVSFVWSSLPSTDCSVSPIFLCLDSEKLSLARFFLVSYFNDLFFWWVLFVLNASMLQLREIQSFEGMGNKFAPTEAWN